MKILVCIKQVLDAEVPIRVDASGRWFEAETKPVWRMNAVDEFAVEEALRIRERVPGTTIDAISVGPERIATTLRRTLEMGANEGIHLVQESDAYLGAWTVASLIAAWARPRDYDLILTGAMSEDVMAGQVGPMLAELLGLPWATSVIRAELSSQTLDAWSPFPDDPTFLRENTGSIGPNCRTLYVEREMEGGVREALALALPALIAVQSGINRPRYPALSHVLRARNQTLITLPATGLAGIPARDCVVGVHEPPPSRTGVFLGGSQEDKAMKLIDILKKKALI